MDFSMVLKKLNPTKLTQTTQSQLTRANTETQTGPDVMPLKKLYAYHTTDS